MQSATVPLGEWELYFGLQWLKEPEHLLTFYPEGDHGLVRRRERVLSEHSAVDCSSFWPKGEEYPDCAKFEQYKR
jgi:hypothetical protein